jgi:hypothetical protein
VGPSRTRRCGHSSYTVNRPYRLHLPTRKVTTRCLKSCGISSYVPSRPVHWYVLPCCGQRDLICSEIGCDSGRSSKFCRVPQVTPHRQIPSCLCSTSTCDKSHHHTGWVVSVGPHHAIPMTSTYRVNCFCRQLTLHLMVICYFPNSAEYDKETTRWSQENFSILPSQPAVWCQVTERFGQLFYPNRIAFSFVASFS